MLKSALKKPCVEPQCNGKRVTFCRTVKIYSTEELSEDLNEEPSEAELEDLSDDWDPFASQCIILSWQESDEEVADDAQSEKPEHFQVHKMVYGPDDFTRDDSMTDREDLTSAADQESDCQTFIVHQVERLENEDYETSSDSEGEQNKSAENAVISQQESTDINENICKLSVENIEQHNKLMETEILSEVPESKEENTSAICREVGLSPPLQELGIDRLICTPADKWFWNLDISPLNSVQETDTESNLSSEDTMIMMTSEECEKNERRIQESFKKFETIKKLKAKVNGCAQVSGPEEASSGPELRSWAGHEDGGEVGAVSYDTWKTPEVENCDDESRFEKVLQMFTDLEATEVPSVSFTDTPEQNNLGTVNAHTVPESSCEELQIVQGASEEQAPHSSPSSGGENCVTASAVPVRESAIELDRSLSVVEIPQDVREWKIEIAKSALTNRKISTITSDCTLRVRETDDSRSSDELGSRTPRPSKVNERLDQDERCDELEQFVDQCTERVERIRKRYSLSDNTVWSPRRGIRPRYGSTAAIMQQVQGGGHQHPTLVNAHYSWPYYLSVGCSDIPRHQVGPQCVQSLHSFQSFPAEITLNSRPLSLRFVPEGNADVVRTTGDSVNFAESPPHIPPSLLFAFHERGVPEGASPPRLSSESLCESEPRSDGIVYYSMKV